MKQAPGVVLGREWQSDANVMGHLMGWAIKRYRNAAQFPSLSYCSLLAHTHTAQAHIDQVKESGPSVALDPVHQGQLDSVICDLRATPYQRIIGCLFRDTLCRHWGSLALTGGLEPNQMILNVHQPCKSTSIWQTSLYFTRNITQNAVGTILGRWATEHEAQ